MVTFVMYPMSNLNQEWIEYDWGSLVGFIHNKDWIRNGRTKPLRGSLPV